MAKRRNKQRRPPSGPVAPEKAFSRRWGLAWIAVAIVSLALCAVVIRWHGSGLSQVASPDSVASGVSVVVPEQPQAAAAEYAGADHCTACHATETSEWRASNHAHAMQHATAATVLGDFDSKKFSHFGATTTFFRKDGGFWVNTAGPDGRLADFRVAYTFGVDPLQQYLVAFPDGRVQALPLAWDTRPATAGGQRWFNLHPHERIDHDDPLYWTRREQNWNFMCADCHSTNLRRNFNADSNTFATTWSDINVGCESCHGPGSRHIAWARKEPGWQSIANGGLTIALDERKGVHWERIPGTGNVRRSTPMVAHREAQTCAVCHSRRRAISSTPGPTGQLLDTHDLRLLTPPDYFPDGQVKGEVYVYGSFLQSKMYAAGVTCSDCHNPHTGKLRLAGNATCTQCHAPNVYDAPSHHHHPVGTAGAQCAACHMPTTDFMVIQPRHDHSLRIPRPDLGDALGTPNACTGCHPDKGNAWAAAAVERWYGPEREGFQTWGKAFHDADAGAPDAPAGLAAVFYDAATPDIARASALSLWRRFPTPALLQAIAAGLGDPSALVRIAALDALAEFPPVDRMGALALTDDPLLAVRAQAGFALASMDVAALPASERARVQDAYAAYVASQNAVASRPEAHLNLGLFHFQRGETGQAVQDYRYAIKLDPDFAPAYANLADLYRAMGQEDKVAEVLGEGLKAIPDDPSLLQALALLRVREGHLDRALPLLARAAARAPDDAHLAYVYAVALHSGGKAKQSAAVLDKALQRAPDDLDLLFARASFAREDGDEAAARKFAQRFVQLAPNDPRAQALGPLAR